ncbi:MAG: type II toxin-antitoxin system HicB family antitoxin [Dehalococcoidia bacterium]|nr:type II toxin-antitoxin system HicB family antitoxin [Dehalococcoidia bacterium]
MSRSDTLAIERRAEEAVQAPYTRILRYDAADGIFVLHVLELPGVIAGGETVEEANASLDDGIRSWVEHELRVGHEIPEPFDPEGFSGRVTLRLTPFLHERAQLRAAIEGVSLNRLLETAIAYYLGDRDVPQEAEPMLGQVVGPPIIVPPPPARSR